MRYMLMRNADVDTGNNVPSPALEKQRSQQKLPREMNVHLAFGGNCHEAMAFYAEVTGGNLEAMDTYGETPAAIALGFNGWSATGSNSASKLQQKGDMP